jgi:hypothetical protein
MLEKTTERRTKSKRRITIRGGRTTFESKDPTEIARELRAKSKLGKREARLDAAERKTK